MLMLIKPPQPLIMFEGKCLCDFAKHYLTAASHSQVGSLALPRKQSWRYSLYFLACLVFHVQEGTGNAANDFQVALHWLEI
jgi:hypothetical protein